MGLLGVQDKNPLLLLLMLDQAGKKNSTI